MSWVRAFAAFWYDFVVGDDWRIALGVVAGLALTALLHDAHASAWWLLPAVVVAILTLSLRRATRQRETDST